MICPECNTENEDSRKFCHNCGAPLPKSEKNKKVKEEPQLSRGMMIFIVVGLVFLAVFGGISFMSYSGEPEYIHTMIEPDTNLAEKNGPKFDTLVIDTAKRDSIKKAEKQEAEKLLNSIRHRKTEETASEENSGSENGVEGQTSTESETGTPSTTAVPEPQPQTPKPTVETIGTE